jgi:hypothetical protein
MCPNTFATDTEYQTPIVIITVETPLGEIGARAGALWFSGYLINLNDYIVSTVTEDDCE